MSSLHLVKIWPATFNNTTDGKETIRGVVHSIRDIPTKTGTKKVLVSVGNVICKIFAETAEEFIQKQINYEGKEAEFCGRWDVSRPGRKEFIIEAATCKPKDVRVEPVDRKEMEQLIDASIEAAITQIKQAIASRGVVVDPTDESDDPEPKKPITETIEAPKTEPKAEPVRVPQRYEIVAIIDPTTGGTIGLKRIAVPVQSRHAHLIECCSQFSTKYLEAELSDPKTPQEYKDAYSAILQSRKIGDLAEPVAIG